jgi:dTDP-4-dehydrorhamnose reductase
MGEDKRMRILLTGATGFLGSRALLFLQREHDVCALPSALLRGEFTGERGQRLYDTAAAFAPEIILHMAAIADTAYAERHQEESRLANVELPLTLARIAARVNAKLIACSSDQVYNACDGEGPFAENIPLTPDSVYGRHKQEAEERILQISSDAVSLRLSWMYDLPSCGLPIHPNLLTSLLVAAIRQEPLRVSQTDLRGVTYARHVIEQLPQAFALAGGVYNFGSKSRHSVWQIANGWCAILGIDAGVLIPIQGKPRSLCMDCAKIKARGIVLDDSVDGIRRCARDYGLSALGWKDSHA